MHFDERHLSWLRQRVLDHIESMRIFEAHFNEQNTWPEWCRKSRQRLRSMLRTRLDHYRVYRRAFRQEFSNARVHDQYRGSANA